MWTRILHRTAATATQRQALCRSLSSSGAQSSAASQATREEVLLSHDPALAKYTSAESWVKTFRSLDYFTTAFVVGGLGYLIYNNPEEYKAKGEKILSSFPHFYKLLFVKKRDE